MNLNSRVERELRYHTWQAGLPESLAWQLDCSTNPTLRYPRTGHCIQSHPSRRMSWSRRCSCHYSHHPPDRFPKIPTTLVNPVLYPFPFSPYREVCYFTVLPIQLLAAPAFHTATGIPRAAG